MKEFLIFSLLIYGSLFLGWAARKISPPLQGISRAMTRWTVLLVDTPTILLIYWGIRWEQFVAYFPIPLISVVVFSVSGAVGYFVARLYGKDRLFEGAFTVSAMFSNIGPTVGGFLCLLYFGSEGLLLSQIYTLLSVPYFFTAVFMVARRFSASGKKGFAEIVRANFKEPISVLPVCAIVVGVALGLGGAPFPTFLDFPRKVFVYAAAILFSLSFGLGMQVRLLFRGIKHYLGLLPVKFIIAPAMGAVLAVLAGYTLHSDALAFKVVVVQSAMPVAIWAVVAAKVFELDENLAVGLWIFTTVATAGLLPFIDWLSRL